MQSDRVRCCSRAVLQTNSTCPPPPPCTSTGSSENWGLYDAGAGGISKAGNVAAMSGMIEAMPAVCSWTATTFLFLSFILLVTAAVFQFRAQSGRVEAEGGRCCFRPQLVLLA